MAAIDLVTIKKGDMFGFRTHQKATLSTTNAFQTSGGGGAVTTYRMRGYDSGSGGRYVYWSSTTTPNVSPGASDTTPTTAGSLTNVAIVGIE